MDEPELILACHPDDVEMAEAALRHMPEHDVAIRPNRFVERGKMYAFRPKLIIRGPDMFPGMGTDGR